MSNEDLEELLSLAHEVLFGLVCGIDKLNRENPSLIIGGASLDKARGVLSLLEIKRKVKFVEKKDT